MQDIKSYMQKCAVKRCLNGKWTRRNLPGLRIMLFWWWCSCLFSSLHIFIVFNFQLPLTACIMENNAISAADRKLKKQQHSYYWLGGEIHIFLSTVRFIWKEKQVLTLWLSLASPVLWCKPSPASLLRNCEIRPTPIRLNEKLNSFIKDEIPQKEVISSID